MMKNLVFTEHTQFIFKSMLAGALLALAGGTFSGCISLTTLSQNLILAKLVGAFLFSLGIIGSIVLKANLYTSKIGYVDTKNKAIRIVWILLINVSIAFIIGFLYRGVNGFIDMGTFGPDSARATRPLYQNFFYGCSCGVLLHIAEEMYRRTKNFLVIIICVMAFILSGGEHGIACAFFFGASELSWIGLGQLWLIILGNTVGGIAISWMIKGADFLSNLPPDIHR